MKSFGDESAALHPSTFIEEEMRERGWDTHRLAFAMGSSNANFIKGVEVNELALDLYITVGPTHPEMRLGDTTPKQLAVAFGTSVELWTNLEQMWLDSLGKPTAEVRS